MRRTAGMLAFLVVLVMMCSAAGAVMDGIWKDVPKNSSGDRYALYIQTYQTGSVVVVLLDNSGGAGNQVFYVFLDSDFTNGVDADELGGAAVHLSLSGLDGASPSGVFSKGGTDVSFTLFKWFDSPKDSGSVLPLDGIYKDAAPPEDTSFNVYLQTYEPEGSAVAVVTTDGGRTYQAFLDADISDGFSAADDLLGKGAALTLTVDSVTTATFAYTAPDGTPRSGSLHQWFQAPATAGTYTLKGHLLHNGLSMANITTVKPDFWARDETVRWTSDWMEATYDSATGAYELRYLPAQVGVVIVFPVSGSPESLPGNYRQWVTIDVAGLTPGERESYDIEVPVIMHLTSPHDNSQVTFSTEDPPPTHTAPVLFQWDPVAGATCYEVEIDRYRDVDHPDGYAYLENVIREDVTVASYSASLVPSASHEHYEFNVSAYNGEVRLGYYMLTYTNGFGWHYWFKVASP